MVDVRFVATRMLVYDMSIDVVRATSPLVKAIEAVDPDLARQMRKASSSVPLNMAEGLHSQGRNRESRLYTAMASARETIACLDVAAAAGYIAEAAANRPRTDLDQIVAILYTLIQRRQR